jgi:RecA-family ATPase
LWHAPEAGDVCFVAGEDTVNDIRARLCALKLTADEAAKVAKRVHIMPTSGVDARWTDEHGAPTLAFAALRERIAEKAPALVILDPGARFFGPDVEVDNAQATAWIRQAEELQRLASCPTVLVAMHTRKGGGLDQNAVRGSSALVDGARWVAALERVSDQGAPVDLMRIKRVKVNNCPPDDGARIVERKRGGRIGYCDAGSWHQWTEYKKDHKSGDGEAHEAEGFDADEGWRIAKRNGTEKEFSAMMDAFNKRKAGRRD